MCLQYGVNPDGELIAIDQVRRGKTGLTCPYCGGFLAAKKGRIKAHHFAHIGETCRAVSSDRDIDLPTYDRFNLHLSPKDFEAFTKFRRGHGPGKAYISFFERRELIKWNDFKGRGGGYEFTMLGKIPFGALSLMLFNQVQEPLILGKLARFTKRAESAYKKSAVDLLDYVADLRLYRAQLRRILASTLYYLEVRADGNTLYKIGVTTRSVEERIPEIEQELRSHYQSVAIKVLGNWPHRGNVERYFIHRYHSYQHPIGTLTEYFKFDDPDQAKSVLRDLRRMKPKMLSPDEVEILEVKPACIGLKIKTDQRRQQRSAAIKTGMDRARSWGTHVGRPNGQESVAEFLAKPKNQEITQALNEGLSLRKAAKRTGAAINTVRKVKVLMIEKAHL